MAGAKIRGLQMWCKRQCEGYRDVEVKDMTSSFKSGLAFCAIIHRYRPDLIDYDSLSKENVYENNKLAFDVAHESLDLPALLDPEDMVAMTVPDKLCIVTYVSQYYNYFRDKTPEGGPGVSAPRTPTKRPSTAQVSSSAPGPKKITPTKTVGSSLADKSNQDVLPSRGPSASTSPSFSSLSSSSSSASSASSQSQSSYKRGTYGDTCHICKKKVYLMERHMEGSRLYHRKCFRDQQKAQISPPLHSNTFKYPQQFQTQNANLSHLNSPAAGKPSSVTVTLSNNNYSSTVSASPVGSATNPSRSQSNLVKMLYGGPAPYGGLSTQEKNVASQSSVFHQPTPSYRTNTSLATSSSSSSSSTTTVNSVLPGAGTPSQSISQRAKLFDKGPKPKFGAAAGVSDNQTNATPPYSSNTHHSVDSRMQEPMDVDTTPHSNFVSQSKPVFLKSQQQQQSENSAVQGITNRDDKIKTGLLASLSNIRRANNIVSGSSSVSTTSLSVSPVTTSSLRTVNNSSPVLSSTQAYTVQQNTGSILTNTSSKPSFEDGKSMSGYNNMHSHRSSSPHTTHVSKGTHLTTKSILKPNEPIELEIDLGNRHSSGVGSRPTSVVKHVDTGQTAFLSSQTRPYPAPRQGANVSSLQLSHKSPLSSVSDPRSSVGLNLGVAPQPDRDIVVTPSRAQIKLSSSELSGSKSGSTIPDKPKSPRPAPRKNLPTTNVKPWERPTPRPSDSGPSLSSSVSQGNKNNSANSNSDSQLKYSQGPVSSAKGSESGHSTAFSKTSSDADKGTNAKPSWKIEIDARKGIQNKTPPSRPVVPPQGQPSPINKGAKDTTKTEKPEWQMEAERRKEARQGKYQDPEYKYKYMKQDGHNNIRGQANVEKSQGGSQGKNTGLSLSIVSPRRSSSEGMERPTCDIQGTRDTPPASPKSNVSTPSPPARPPPPKFRVPTPETSPSVPSHYEMIKDPPFKTDPHASPPNSGRLSRAPAFRVADSPQSSPESGRSNSKQHTSSTHIQINGDQPAKKKILPEVNFSFRSGDFDMVLDSTREDQTSPSSHTDQTGGRNSWIQQRPLPMPPRQIELTEPERRQVRAEERVGTLKIMRELEEVDRQLRSLEEQGRSMEEKIRAVSDDQMDDEESMTAWFETISKRNDLVRRETELMYKQKQQELEDVHSELEYELRVLMSKPEHEKTASDLVREQTLMAELLDTVNQRNSIVDSMEEDRLRYIAEDEEIAEKMAKTVSLTTDDSDKKKKKKGEKNKRTGKHAKK